MAEINVRSLKDVDLKGGTVLAACPSVGLVSTIAATFMISSLQMDQVAAFDADDFPPLSMVYAHKPKFPVRLYAAPREKIACFVSEVALPVTVHRPVARTLLGWVKTQGVRRVVCLEGLPLPKEQTHEEIDVWAVGTTDGANGEIEKAGIPYLETGMVSGVAGVMLNEGRWQGYDVIAVLAEARPFLPDAFAASRLVHAVDKLLPGVEIDLSPLLEQAKQLEAHLQTLTEQAKPVTPEAPSYLYR